MAWQASIPRRAAVPTMERTNANKSAPHSERKPPVTLRKVAVGCRSRSLLFVVGRHHCVFVSVRGEPLQLGSPEPKAPT